MKRYSVDFAVLAIVVDFLCTILGLGLTSLFGQAWLRLVWPRGWFYEQGRFITPLYWPLIGLLWLVVFIFGSVYDPRRIYRAVDEFQRVAVAVLFADLMLAGLLYLTQRELSRWLFALFLLINWILLLGWRIIARLVRRSVAARITRPRRVLVVGAGKVGQQVAEALKKDEWGGLEFVGFVDDDDGKRESALPVLGTLDDAERLVRECEIDEVVIALPSRAWQRMNQLVSALHAYPVHIHVIPDYFAITLWRASVEDFAGIPMIDVRAPALNEYQRLVKRIFDLCIGSVALLLSLPIMALIALAIKLDSPGPILYKPERVGENGRLFRMYKFRSMIVGADDMAAEMIRPREDGTISYKRRDDPRVTRVGKFIRRTSLDELPQLFNVLKGEMSLVGPRPEMPWMVERYEAWQRKRFAAPQGMTGWWQINGRSDKEMYLHTDEDLYYLQNYSLSLDLLILLRTLLVVLKGRGAY
ncbi:MAG: sugar transferase [Chloroflexi bacterium]|nr:sugar transferase [Chloroflexota bacterium]